MAVSSFGFNNYIKTGAISGVSSSVPGLDPSQWQTNDAGAASMAWQTQTTLAGFTLTAPGAGSPLGAVAFARTNLSAGAALTLQIWTNVARTTLRYGIAAAPMDVVGGLSVFLLPAGTIGHVVDVVVSDPTNPDGYLNMPLCYIGPTFTPRRSISWSTTRGRDQRIDEIVTRSGVEFPQARWQRRRWSIDAQSIDPTEAATYDALDSFARTGGNVLFVQDPAQAAGVINGYAIFGRATPKADFGYIVGGQRQTWKADLTERL